MRYNKFSLSISASAILLTIFMAGNAGLAQAQKKTPPPPPPPRPAARPAPVPQPRNVPAPQPRNVPAPQPRSVAPTPPVRPSAVTPPAPGARPVPGALPNGRPGTPSPAISPAPKPMAPPRPPAPAGVDRTTGKFTAPAGAKVTPRPGGGQQIKTADKTINVDKQGRATSIQTNSGTVARMHNGKVTTVSKLGPDGTGVMTHTSPTGVRSVHSITRDEHGGRVDTVVHGNHVYREHDIPGRAGYRQRTTIVENRTVVTVYRETTYRGYAYPVYVPAYYYPPRAYLYFGSPWSSPVVYGWGGLQLSSGFGIYFAPTVTYASPDAYVADYAIGQNLQAAQAAQETATPDDAESQTGSLQPIPPQVRQDYVSEVATERQLQAADAAGHPSASAIPGALDPKFTLFQSWSDTEADNNGEQCAISGGDFVRRVDLTPDANKTVAVKIASVVKATPSHCAVDSTVRIPVDTLQEWFNKFIESQQAGYESMVSGDNHTKFPAVPGDAPVPNPAGTATADDPAVIAQNSHEAVSNASKAESELHSGGA